MIDGETLGRVRGSAWRLFIAMRWLLCGLMMLVGQLPVDRASAQSLPDPRPANRRICDIDVTVVAGQNLVRDGNNDQIAGNCTGTFVGTPRQSEGQPGPNSSDTGLDDQYPTAGTTRPNSTGGTPVGAGRWATAAGQYAFTYAADAGAAGQTDTFLVFIYNTAGRDSARIYYHVTVTSAVPTPPTVSSVSPASGGLQGGSSVVITGTNFTGATAVTFGGTGATAFTVNSATQITASLPAGSSPGTRQVVVTNAAGSSTDAVNYRYYATVTNGGAFAPGAIQTGGTSALTFTLTNPSGNPGSMSQAIFSSAIPSGLTLSAPATSCGGTVTITGGTISLAGGSLAAGASCTVTANASATTAGSYQITPGAVSAQGARDGTTGTQSTVSGTAGTAVSLTVNAPTPTLSTIAPTSGPTAGGTSVVITGTNLTGATAISFGGTAATSFTVDSDTQITATAPARAAGAVDVAVTTPGGTANLVGAYSFVAAPTLTSVSPNSGSTAGGTAVVITGTNLGGATAVSFGGTAATSFTVNSATQITATAPAGAAGPVSIAVTTPGGTGQLANAYIYVVLSPPAVTTQPASQTVAVGATATFTAAAAGSPSPTVQWQVSSDGGASFTNISGATATSYTTPATGPADNGTRYRAVFSNSQGAATSNAATLTVVQAPTANGQTITTAYQTARAITLTASDPNTPARTLTYSVATAPAHGTLSGTAPNLTYTPVAGYTGPDSFTFTTSNGVVTSNTATISITVQGPAPIVSAVSPNQGSTAGGTSITIAGSGFVGATGVTIGGAAATAVTVVSDTQITATTPAGTAGAASVVVTNATGSNAANTLFTYVAAPTANDQSVTATYRPSSSATGSTTITVTGSDPAGRPLTFTLVSAPTKGTLTGFANGAATAVYTPNVGARGSDSFRFSASNGIATGEGTISIAITDPTITLTGPTTTATRGIAYSSSVSATGGTAPYAFQVTAGTLPAGLTLGSSTGSASTITGTPTASGTFTFTITASDQTPGNPPITASQSYTIAVAGPTLSASPAAGAVPTATVGQPYSQTLSTSGGTAPYSYAITSGALPSGLTLSAGGAISGTPVQAGNATFAVTATDSSTAGSGGPYTITTGYTLQVNGAVVTVSPASVTTPQVGVAYSQVFTASGGTAPYSYSVSGTLPAGLSFNAATATLSGTPTQAGTFSFTIVATDSSTGAGAPFAGSRAYSLTVQAPTLALTPIAGTSTPTALPGAIGGQAYSQTFSTSGGTAPYGYSLGANSTLPPGLTLSNVGTLSGTPTSAGTFAFTVRSTDSSSGSPFFVEGRYTITVTAPSIAVTPATLPGGTVAQAYSQSFGASGGTGSYAYAITAGALPAGLTLDATGVLSGTPVAGGSFTFTVRATDQNGYDGQRSLTLTIAAPTQTLTPTQLPGGTRGGAYSSQLTASGGTLPYSYAISAGTLPAGLSLSTTGTISGTPTAGGAYNFTVTATDSSTGSGPYQVSQAYTLAIDVPTIALTPSTLPAATTRIAYSQALTASGGAAPYAFTVSAGTLPTGLSLSSTGTLSGTPTIAGNASFTVTATDANGNAASQAYTLEVTAPAIALTPATLPAATTRIAYSQALAASGGVAPYAFTVSAGTLPAGLNLSSTGTLSGTPTTAGTASFTITATDANGNTASQAYTLEVTAPAIALTPATLPAATTRIAYSQALAASGGAAPYAFTVSAGTLPAGLNLSSTGTLSGTPTTAGTASFTVTATDANGNTASQAYTLEVTAPAIAIGPQTLAQAQVGAAYNAALSATGGAAPYAYRVTDGALPTGVSLAPDGTLSGTPTAGGNASFTVVATDANGNTASRSFTLAVAASQLALTPDTVAEGQVGTAYSQTLVASGGVAPYAYAVTSGRLPAGLTLSAAGILSGTPTQSGSFPVTIAATDSATGSGPYSISRNYTLVIAAPSLALDPATLAEAQVGTAYRAQIGASGGTAPYSYQLTAGALPAGMSLAGDGTITGTPNMGGRFTFTVTATDATAGANGGPYSASRAYTLTVAAAQLVLTPDSLPAGQSGVAYSQTLTSSGGTAPYAYAVTAGRLPTGLSLSATGMIAGTPTQSGSFAVTVTATDASTGSGPYATSRAYTLTIAAPTLTLAAQTLPAAPIGTAYRAQLSASGGTGPYRYQLASGALPAGVTLSADGTIAGTPSAGGSFGFTVTATDATAAGDGGPYSASQSYTLAATAPTLTITPTALPDGAYQTAYSQQLSTTGGTAPYRYRVASGALPGGVTLSAEGLISGTPNAIGRFELTITATDSSGGSGPFSVDQAVTLTIQPPATPVVADVAVTIAYGATGDAITPKLTGGTATGVAIASQPSHGTASVEGSTLVYTPAQGYAGPDSFTYTATNAGGTSAPATVSITVSAPQVVVGPATLADARQGEAYSQPLAASGGVAPYSFAIVNGTLPAGLELSASGVLSGTPTASGTATFTVRATDASTGTGPFSGTQSYTLTVALPAAPTIRPLPMIDATGSSAVESRSTEIVLSDYVSGQFSDIQLATPPANGTATLTRNGDRFLATYVPRAEFAGRDSFAILAVGLGGRSAVTTVTLQVAGAAPAAATLTAQATQGTPVTVDLTAASSGGPFTGAAITAIAPAGQVTAQIVESGTAGARRYAVTLTPALSFSGTATITYTLSNQYGTSRPATITLEVAARPDPSADPTVNALSAAQADATRRFVRAQTDNFFRRNEQLHHGGAGTAGASIGNTLGFGFGGMGSPQQVMPGTQDLGESKTLRGRGLATPIVGTVGGLPGMMPNGGASSLTGGATAQPGTGGLGAAPQTEDGEGGSPANAERRIGSVGLWSGGAVTVGGWDSSARRAKMAITSGGLSAGADLKLTERLIMGVGGGYGREATRIGGGKGQLHGDSWSLAGYGSWQPVEGLFIDGVAGGGSVSFDTQRRVDAVDSVALGHRQGGTWFGSLATGFDRQGERLGISAYGRADYLSARLDRFTEQGAGIYNLTFARRHLQSLTGILGTRIVLPMRGVTPRMRFEWRHEFADMGLQAVDYADIVDPRYVTRGDIWLRDAFALDLGIDIDLGTGWGLTTEVGGSTGSGATMGTGRIGVRKTF